MPISNAGSGRFRLRPPACRRNWPPAERTLAPWRMAGILSQANSITILNGLEQIGEKAASVSGISRRRRSRRRSPLRRKAAGQADRRHRLQTAQRPQSQRADRHRSSPLRPRQTSTVLQINSPTRMESLSIAPNKPAMPPCRPTRTCSARSLCLSRTGCWLMSKCSCATPAAWRIAASG